MLNFLLDLNLFIPKSPNLRLYYDLVNIQKAIVSIYHSKYNRFNNSVIKIMYIKYIVIPHSKNYFPVYFNFFFHTWEERREKERGNF